MTHNMTRYICAVMWLAATLTLVSCTDSQDTEASRWLSRATSLYGEKHYDEALAAIDSLRSRCPRAVAARREALALLQTIELDRALSDIATTDSALTQATVLYTTMKAEADRCHAAGTATSAQLTAVTRQRLLCDSLHAAFELQCAKVKYIRDKQNTYGSRQE